jgi:tellurite resistance protein
MEAIIFIVILFFGGAIIRFLINTGKSAVRVAQGKEPLYSGPLQMKLDGEEVDGTLRYRPMFRGDVPVVSEQSLAISLVLRDVTNYDDDEEFWPVISLLEQLQEESTISFEFRQDTQARPDTVWSEWVRHGVILPEMLQPPFSGSRKIQASLVFFTNDGSAVFEHGRLSSGDGVLKVISDVFTFDFEDVGYREESENQKEGSELAIKVAIAVAMADGTLDDSEGQVIQAWMRKNLDMMSESQQEEMRPRLNLALKTGYAEADSGDLALSSLCERIAEIATVKSKYDTIELCMDVMVADGVADESELRVINSIASSIGLDMKEIDRMKDERMVSSNLQATENNAFAMLGIEDSMTKREKEKQLRAEFQKWNNRLTTLDAGEERNNAQRMLDLVSSARAGLNGE